MKQKRIVIIATLDTKGEEADYLRKSVIQKGHIPTVIDSGVYTGHSYTADISNEKVANSIGLTIQEIQNSKDEGEAISLMIKGVSTVIQQLVAEGQADGILAIGGSMGTSLGLKVMKSIPVSIPKLMLSTIAFTPYITSDSVSIDMTMMQTITDLRGINTITKTVLKKAVGAICGMAEVDEEVKQKFVVGLTGLGGHMVVEKCRPLLIENGYEPVIFHSVGTGACEQLVIEGFVDGLLDFSMFELVNLVCEGEVKGGELKITAACEKGIPQVIAPGALDFFSWSGSLDTLPDKFKDRNNHVHNPLVILIPTTEEERIAVANEMIERINKAHVPTALLFPLRGFSRQDNKGMPFYNPGAAQKVFEIFKHGIKNSMVDLVPLNAHINDDVFAETAVRLLSDKMNKFHNA